MHLLYVFISIIFPTWADATTSTTSAIRGTAQWATRDGCCAGEHTTKSAARQILHPMPDAGCDDEPQRPRVSVAETLGIAVLLLAVSEVCSPPATAALTRAAGSHGVSRVRRAGAGGGRGIRCSRCRCTRGSRHCHRGRVKESPESGACSRRRCAVGAVLAALSPSPLPRVSRVSRCPPPQRPPQRRFA